MTPEQFAREQAGGIESSRGRLLIASCRSGGYLASQVVVTDSIPQKESFRSLPFVSVRTLSALLALVINRLHYNRSAGDLVG
jgi:phosphoribosylpyrophosphate synthetase